MVGNYDQDTVDIRDLYLLTVFLGTAPSGEVTFLSRCYGGRTTDAQIVQESGFLKLVEANDIVLADKGRYFF